MMGRVTNFQVTVGRRILIVETCDEVRRALHSVLANEGHYVRSARDAASAEDQTANWSPEVVLIDVRAESEFRIARRLRGQTAEDGLLIALSTSSLPSAWQAVFDYSFRKPFEIGELLAVVSASSSRRG